MGRSALVAQAVGEGLMVNIIFSFVFFIQAAIFLVLARSTDGEGFRQLLLKIFLIAMVFFMFAVGLSLVLTSPLGETLLGRAESKS